MGNNNNIVFYTTGGEVFEATNQYGDIVKMYGDGIYTPDTVSDGWYYASRANHISAGSRNLSPAAGSHYKERELYPVSYFCFVL